MPYSHWSVMIGDNVIHPPIGIGYIKIFLGTDLLKELSKRYVLCRLLIAPSQFGHFASSHFSLTLMLPPPSDGSALTFPTSLMRPPSHKRAAISLLGQLC